CQRYYYQRDWTAQYQAILVPCWASGANALQGTFYPPVTMRADPTCSHNGVGNFRVNNSLGADQVCNNIIFSAPLKESVVVTFQKATSDLSTTSSGYINTEANNDASMYFDAEL
ncbi:MAG: hypothetical protein P8P29_07570, partial [Flavobacteriaceae bacterium]|nr:hypothetical protein [Flavobacteriaceae bacterium]